MNKIELYLIADLSGVYDVERLTPQERAQLLVLLEKVCDYYEED